MSPLSPSPAQRAISYARPWRWHKRRLERRLNNAATYEEWKELAEEYDRIDGRDLWKLEPEAPLLYDHKTITARLLNLKEARICNDPTRSMMTVRENLSRNLGGLGNPGLYNTCMLGTKRLVDQYLDEVEASIDNIVKARALSLAEKEHFFADSRQAYGRSALLLSGGASLGALVVAARRPRPGCFSHAPVPSGVARRAC